MGMDLDVGRDYLKWGGGTWLLEKSFGYEYGGHNKS